ncbi:MAG: EAL domain-containing protein [Clostridiales bacterium]|nr:EAL domain-containing protein [Clostridiales bacterium]
MLYLFCVFFESDIYAADKRLVKVAFFPMDGYHVVNSDGTYNGMDVEYLNALCEYADWKIEYVKCDSWEEALQLLRDKQVDLVGSAQYSYERAEIYQYADLSSGYTFGVIATSPESSIAYEDFEAMRRITFGMVENYVRRDEFLQYLQDHGIQNPTIKEYTTTADLQNALSEGEIDALVHTFTEVKEGQRLIGRFAPRPFYYITYQENDDVMRELNQAAADLKMNHPELETELMNKFYYNKFDKTALLTTGENAYIAEKRKVVAGYLDGFYPFSYEKDGEFKGLARELLENGVGATGLELEYRRLDNRQDGQTALQKGEIDILAYCTDTKAVLEESQLAAVCDYAEVPLVLVMEKNRNMNEIDTLATVPFLADKVGIVVSAEETEVVTYDTQQECIDAVTENEVDAVLCDGYQAEYLMRTELRYGNLQIKNVFNGEYSISLAIRKEDELLSDILEKTISPIDSKMINAYMLKENTYPLVSIIGFVRNNSLWIIGILSAGIIVIILVATHMVNDSKKIQKLLYKDTKMDIWNLNYLMFWGEHKLLPERSVQYAVVYVKLAQFRRYNVIYGWNAGEHLLESVAGILIKSVDAKTEICARNQGDRFVMLLSYSDQDAFMERIQTIKSDIEKWILRETDNHMSLQMGIYHIPQDDSDLRLAINYANQALEFTENRKGKEIKTYDDSLEVLIKERHERERLLESVDVQKDFVAYYQPKVDIRNGKVVGAEALVRFLDPTEGGKVKAPGFFVPYYEQTGKITEIDFFVFESVCKMLRRRIDAGLPVVTVSCNFSRMHFIKPGFPEHFVEILDRYQISKDLIEIEITETLVVEELQQNMVKRTLDILNEKGVRLSIDDFGAGYSSLGVFEQIPASVIKLDRSFLLNQEDRDRQVKIMRGIVKLTEELEAQVVCEGVETEADVSLMKEIGAYVAQGYFYSRPVPEADFEALLAAML